MAKPPLVKSVCQLIKGIGAAVGPVAPFGFRGHTVDTQDSHLSGYVGRLSLETGRRVAAPCGSQLDT
jgi:hypothetical protein